MKKKIILLIAIFILFISHIAYAKRELVLFWYLDINNPKMIHMKEVIKEFEKENNVSVVVHYVYHRSTDEFHEVYLNILSSGSEIPDIIQIDKIRIPEFAELGYIADITRYFPINKAELFLPNDIKEITWKDKRWAIPFFTTTGIILYRKDLLKKYGYDPPKTWTELINIATKIQEKENVFGYVGQMANYEGLVCNSLEFFWSNGANLKFFPSVKIDQTNTIEALQLMVDIVNKYRITPENQLRYKEAEGLKLFAEGKVLFAREWSWPDYIQGDYNVSPKLMEATGVLPMPKGPSGTEGVSLAGGWALAVNKKTRNSALAIKLIKRLTDRKAQKYTMLNLGGLPSRISLYKDVEIIKKYPWIKEIYKIRQKTKIRPRSQYYPELSKIMQEEFHLALEGKITPKLALERVQNKWKSFVKSTNEDNKIDKTKSLKLFTSDLDDAMFARGKGPTGKSKEEMRH